MFVIAVFSSRNETLYFANMFKSNNLYAMIINTPKEAGQACGISVKFDARMINIGRQFLSSKPFRSFVGFFSLKYINNRQVVERL